MTLASTSESCAVELSILLPCLNEEETLGEVLRKCLLSIELLQISAEVIVADNGSTDSSKEIARTHGAKVIDVQERGYGAAILGGLHDAHGKYVVMGDADDSYYLDEIQGFVDKLNEGYDLVVGNRFHGGIDPDAMPLLHKYLGNPVLSWIGRLFFKVKIGDFHCGLRAFRRDAIKDLQLKATGMEFASEMIVKAALNGLRITEVPAKLKKDGRSRKPHLRTWRDGWRHLVFLLAACPRWLFLYPAILLIALGGLGVILTIPGEFTVATYKWNLNSYFISLACLMLGTQTLLLSILVRIFSSNFGFLPQSKNLNRFEKYFSLERGILLGALLLFFAIFGLVSLFIDWTGSGYSSLNLESSLRVSGIIVFSLTVGLQLIFASFFAALLQV